MSTMLAPRPVLQAPLWNQAMSSFLPPERRRTATPWLSHVPLVLLVLLQVALSLRLRNTPYEDEALYINVGHDYLDHLFHGTAVPDSYGDYLSGVPGAYPVVAALLDSIGGLWLVRGGSLLMMVVAMLAMRATVRHLWGRRCATFAALVFIVTGPVLFTGMFATFDAAVLACLATALWLGVTQRSYASAVGMGLLLALSGILKYTGVAFMPAVLVLTVVAAHRQQPRAWTRAVIAAVVATVVLLVLFVLFGESVREGIAFTTTSRAALYQQSTLDLLRFLAVDVGWLLLLALAGTVVILRDRLSVRSVLLVGTLLGAALLLPLAQLRLGEGASFEKHLSYTALFLAPLAARMLNSVSYRRLGPIAVLVLVAVIGTTGLARSHATYQWGNVKPVVDLVERDPAPGRYLSTSPEAMRYYSRDLPQVAWDNPYAVLGSGPDAIRRSVSDKTWELVVLRSQGSDNASLDDNKDLLLEAVDASPDYDLVAVFPTQRYSSDSFRVYRRAVQPATADASPTPTAATQERLWQLAEQFGQAFDPQVRARLLAEIDRLATVPGVQKGNRPSARG